ncbi:MAG: hypothetical protein DMG32_11500 [Acidobacteria bacterium]|nr:MAG: hypothetical protein DMG32_11500 [Acidobacteriota bacterium]
MKSAIRRSGYFLEQRVRRAIQEDGFYVHSNSTFPDPLTGKSREYDISAVTAFDLLGRRRKIDFLWFHIVCDMRRSGLLSAPWKLKSMSTTVFSVRTVFRATRQM